MYYYTCPICQKQFSDYENKRKYCSFQCTISYWRSDEFKFNKLINHYEKYVIRNKEGCWSWNGPITQQGYGWTFFKKRMSASRASFIIHFGEIPDNIHVLHKCDNPICTRPDHLFLGNHFDNMRDKVNKGRHNIRKGSQIGNSKLKEYQVIEIKKLLIKKEKPKIIADLFKISRRLISAIKTGKVWKHLNI